jgi:hypothetical protein
LFRALQSAAQGWAAGEQVGGTTPSIEGRKITNAVVVE